MIVFARLLTFKTAILNITKGLLFLALGLLISHYTIPLNHFADGGRYGDADTLLYVTLWGIHALFHNPLTYYDTPFFYPVKHAVLGTDGMELAALVTSPVWLLTKTPAIVENTWLLISNVSVLVSYYLCFKRVIKLNFPLALALAFAGAASSDRFWHAVDHHNLICTATIPLTFLFTWKALEGQKKLWIGLALVLGLSVYSSVYFFVLSYITLIFSMAVFVVAEPAKLRLPHITRILAACIGGGLIACPKILVYFFGSRGLVHNHDTLAEADGLSATLMGYLRPPYQENRIISNWYRIFGKPDNLKVTQEDGQFIGYLILSLIGIEMCRLTIKAVRRQFDRADRFSAACMAVSIILMMISFGPRFEILHVSFYKIVYYAGLKYSSFFRAPARFAFIFEVFSLVPVAILLSSFKLGNRESFVPALMLMVAVVFEQFPQKSQPFKPFVKFNTMDFLHKEDPTDKQAYVDIRESMTLPAAIYDAPRFRPTVNGWQYAAFGQQFDRRYFQFMNFPTSGTLAWLSKNSVPWIIANGNEMVDRSLKDDNLELKYKDTYSAVFQVRNPRQFLAAYESEMEKAAQQIQSVRENTPESIMWPQQKWFQIVYGGTPGDTNTIVVNSGTENSGSLMLHNVSGAALSNFDKIRITYDLDIPADHNVQMYWKPKTENMSEYRTVLATVSREDDGFIATLDSAGIKPWFEDTDLDLMRIDFHGFGSFKNTNVFIRKIEMTRDGRELDIPDM